MAGWRMAAALAALLCALLGAAGPPALPAALYSRIGTRKSLQPESFSLLDTQQAASAPQRLSDLAGVMSGANAKAQSGLPVFARSRLT